MKKKTDWKSCATMDHRGSTSLKWTNDSCEIKANQSCTGLFMRLHNHIQLTSSPEEDSQCTRQLKYHNWHGK